MPAGRPSKYTAKIADRVCFLISTTTRGLIDIGEEVGVAASTIVLWANDDREGFAERYTRAKQTQMELMGEEMIDIADNGFNDWMERKDADGENTGWAVNGEHIQRSRVRIETRKWLMSKLAPQKYGDKQQHTGSDGVGPMEIIVRRE